MAELSKYLVQVSHNGSWNDALIQGSDLEWVKESAAAKFEGRRYRILKSVQKTVFENTLPPEDIDRYETPRVMQIEGLCPACGRYHVETERANEHDLMHKCQFCAHTFFSSIHSDLPLTQNVQR